MARRRNRRNKGTSKVNISIAKTGFGIYAADQFGLIDAVDFALDGNFGGMKSSVRDAVNITSVTNVATTGLLLGIAGKIIGPMPVFSGKKIRIKVF